MNLSEIQDFDWDLWNIVKNFNKHQVDNKECEDIFFNQHQLVEFDEKHSLKENRYKILGVTDRKRQLLIIFTIRNNKIRIISARDQSRKEKLLFNKIKNDQKT